MTKPEAVALSLEAEQALIVYRDAFIVARDAVSNRWAALPPSVRSEVLATVRRWPSDPYLERIIAEVEVRQDGAA